MIQSWENVKTQIARDCFVGRHLAPYGWPVVGPMTAFQESDCWTDERILLAKSEVYLY
jgi:hypothetical protein